MASESPIAGAFAPVIIRDDISIPQFMTRFNPDNVRADKVVHVDIIHGKEITYRGLREEAAKGAWGLKNEMGLGVQDIVCIIVPNSSDFVILAHSIWWVGAVVSPINPLITAKDFAHCFNLVQPTHIAVSAAYHEKVQEALALYGTGKQNIRPQVFSVLDRIDGLKKFPEDISGTGREQSIEPYNLEGKSSKDVVGSICYSSGTTGKMKGVKLSHYNSIMNALQGRASFPRRQNADQRIIFFAPYSHIYGLATVVFNGMWVGSFTCALPSFDLEMYCRKLGQYRATLAYLVPPVVLLLINSDIPLKYDFSALECMVVTASPMKKALQVRVKTRFPNAKILQGYGLTECSPLVLMQHESEEEYVGTCGKLLSGTEARLVDPITGKDAALGEEGELWIRGPQVMMGYVSDEAATRNTFVGSWLRTGDIMRRDENDNFWVTDRLKEMIKYKGLQIAPSELEDLLLQHPHVIDAAVCAIYDNSQASEVPLAYVSLADPYHLLPEEHKHTVLQDIKDFIDGQVAGYKKLRGGVHHLQVLPKNAIGKILRKDLPAKIKEGKLGLL